MNVYRGKLNDLPAVLTPAQVRDVLGVGRNQVYALLASGKLPSTRISENSIRITRANLLAFLRQNDNAESTEEAYRR